MLISDPNLRSAQLRACYMRFVVGDPDGREAVGLPARRFAPKGGTIMARLLLFGEPSLAEDFDAVVICAYEITDETGRAVMGAHTEADAEDKIARLSAKYPNHRFCAV